MNGRYRSGSRLLSAWWKKCNKYGGMCGHGVLMNVAGLARADPGLPRCSCTSKERCQEGYYCQDYCKWDLTEVRFLWQVWSYMSGRADVPHMRPVL